MRRICAGLLAVLLGLAGCQHHGKRPRATGPTVEEYALPPGK